MRSIKALYISMCLVISALSIIVVHKVTLKAMLPEQPQPVNSDGISPLSQAITNGSVGAVRAILDAGAPINQRDVSRIIDETVGSNEMGFPIHWATLFAYTGQNLYDNGYGGEDILQDILKRYARVRVRTLRKGDTPIHMANSLNDLNLKMRVLRSLVLEGGDINARNNSGKTLLFLSIARREPDYLQRLVTQFEGLLDMEVMDVSPEGVRRSPRAYAEEIMQTGMLQFLPVATKIYTNPGYVDPNGLTSLQLAAMRGDIPTAQEIVNRAGKGALDAVSQNEMRNTALHNAVLQEQVGMVEWLLAQGANLAFRDGRGNTALHLLVKVAPELQSAMLNALLPSLKTPQVVDERRRALYTEVLNATNRDGKTVFDLAVSLGQSPLIGMLVDRFKELISAATLSTARNNASRMPEPPRSELIKALNR